MAKSQKLIFGKHFIYLNNLQESQGGCTEFNKLNIKVAPKKGRLLVFYNINCDYLIIILK